MLMVAETGSRKPLSTKRPMLDDHCSITNVDAASLMAF